MKRRILTVLMSLSLLCSLSPQQVMAQPDGRDKSSTFNSIESKDSQAKLCETKSDIELGNRTTDSGEVVTPEDFTGIDIGADEIEKNIKASKKVKSVSDDLTTAEYLVKPQKDGGITWSIDLKGKLLITGEGNFTTTQYESSDYLRCAPWYDYRANIFSVEVKVKKIKSTDFMFFGCYNIREADVDKLDMSNVKSAKYMFGGCWLLTSVNCGKWDLAKLEFSTGMFQNCYKLAKVDCEKWKTPKLEYTASMFEYTDVESLNLNKWDVSNVKSMESLFERCDQLKTIKISKWNVKNVESFNNFFRYCESLESVSISGWNCKKLKDMGEFFDQCSSLKKVTLKDWKTPKLQTMSNMFRDCTSLQKCDLSSWKNLGELRGIDFCFQGCKNLTSVNVSGFDVPNLVNISYMYNNCTSLKKVSFKGWKVNKTIQLWSTFEGCSELECIDWDTIEFASFRDTIKTFKKCKKLSCQLNVNGNIERFEKMCEDAATDENAKIFINNIGWVSQQAVRNMVNTKSYNSHVYVAGDLKPDAVDFSKVSSTGEGIKLAWKTSLGAHEYKIFKKNANGEFDEIAVVQDKSYVDKTANKNGAKYEYKIQACGRDENPEPSNAKKCVYLKSVKIGSAKLKKYSSKYKSVLLKYKKNKKATGYEIEYGTSSKFTNAKKVKVKSYKTVSYKIKKLKKKTTYYFRVRVYKKNSSGTYYSAWSSKKKVKIGK